MISRKNPAFEGSPGGGGRSPGVVFFYIYFKYIKNKIWFVVRWFYCIFFLCLFSTIPPSIPFSFSLFSTNKKNITNI